MRLSQSSCCTGVMFCVGFTGGCEPMICGRKTGGAPPVGNCWGGCPGTGAGGAPGAIGGGAAAEGATDGPGVPGATNCLYGPGPPAAVWPSAPGTAAPGTTAGGVGWNNLSPPAALRFLPNCCICVPIFVFG